MPITKRGIVVPQSNGGDVEQAGFAQQSSLLKRAQATVLVDPENLDPLLVGGTPVSFSLLESYTYVAAARARRIVWRVPLGKRFYPSMFSFNGITTNAQGELCIGRWLGTWDMVAPLFTLKGRPLAPISATQNHFYHRIAGTVRTTMAATADVLTLTALGSDNLVSSPTLSFAASDPFNTTYVTVGTSYPPATAIVPDALVSNWGYLGVTNVTDDADPAAGVVDLFGENVVSGGTSDIRFLDRIPLGSVWANENDYVIVYGIQPATTAVLRSFYVSGFMTNIPS